MNSDRYITLNVERDSQFTGLPSGTRQLGPYVLLSELGRGAMGTVYEAEHTNLKRRVALKVLPQEMAASPERYARFQREMEAIGKLEHPNIVLATDAGQLDGVCFIAMQLINGIDLAGVLNDQGKLTSPLACEIIRQVALGLNEINSHGMIHRDIKPSNILLATNGEVKILDLGIASLRQGQFADDSLTRTGSFLGTPDYVAPEQIVNLGPIDIRADIYSLGCTFYHLLSGTPPFSGPQYDSFPTKLFGHAKHDPPHLDIANLKIPPAVFDTLLRMLAKDPEQRFVKPLDVVQALEPYCDASGLDALAASYGPSDRTRGKKQQALSVNTEKRRTQSVLFNSMHAKVLGAMGSLFVVLAAIGLIWSFIKTSDDRAKSDEQALTQFRQQPKSNDVEQPALPAKLADDSSSTQLQEQQQANDVEQTMLLAKVAEDSGVIVAEARVLNSNLEEIADSSRAVESNTERIAVTLEQMQAQFSEVVSELHEDPQTPTEWYANALLHAKSGNNGEARRAYLKFFTFDIDVVDPFQNFAMLLKLQEGAASARETFATIPGDRQLASRMLAAISLLPKQDRMAPLQQLIQQRPEFGPAQFALCETFPDASGIGTASDDVISGLGLQMSLLEQIAKKTALIAYLDAHEQGQVLRYYMDQSLVAPTLKKAETQAKIFGRVSDELLKKPIRLNANYQLHVYHWQIGFHFAEDAREPAYRLLPDEDFQPLGEERLKAIKRAAHMIPSGVDLSLMRDAWIELPGEIDRLDVEVKYVDRNDIPRGPFRLNQDLAQARVDQQLEYLKNQMEPGKWILVDDSQLIFSPLLIFCREAVKEIRYGINRKTPDRTFPVPSTNYSDESQTEFLLRSATPIRFAVLQVVLANGEVADIQHYKVEP
jgi:serine/threonine protein kinase